MSPGILHVLHHALGGMKADGGWRQGVEHPLLSFSLVGYLPQGSAIECTWL